MFDLLKDKLSGPEGSARLYGLGLLASGLAEGRVADVSPALDMLNERKQRRALNESLDSDEFMTMFSSDEKAFLSTIPPAAAQQLIGSRIFAQPEPVRGISINDQLINPTNGQVMGDFRTPDAPDPRVRQLTPEEAAGRGLNPRFVWEEQPDGGLRQVDGSGFESTRIITPEEAEQLGYAPGTYVQTDSPEGQDLKAVGTPTTTVNNINQGESAFTQETGKLIAQESAAIAQAGAAAQRSLVQIDALQSSLGNAGGASSAFTAAAANLGLKLDGASDLEAAQALISQLVPQQRPPGTGPMSDADLELYKQSLPRLINTPEGNAQIISTMRRIAEYDVQRGSIARDLQLGQITQEQAFQRYSELNNPLANQATATTNELTPDELKWLEGTQ